MCHLQTSISVMSFFFFSSSKKADVLVIRTVNEKRIVIQVLEMMYEILLVNFWCVEVLF